jgi:light-regulated signal transduction histidine kinase (bacteriophytochrome)
MGKPKVLVIDDNLAPRAELRRALDAAGYEVLSAATTEQALQTAAREHTEAIVLDGALLQRELAAANAGRASASATKDSALRMEIERKNRELQDLSYSVSHDLRAPLRAIAGFSHALLEDFSDALEARALDYLTRIRAAAQRMGDLLDSLLELSRVGRAELRRERVELSNLAHGVMAELQRSAPERQVEVAIEEGLSAEADRTLMRVALHGLLDNAWKFSAGRPRAKIEFGATTGASGPAFFVRDNGTGFDMQYGDKLFRPFQRLHSDADFAGAGIGLAIAQRILDRHGGRVWAESAAGQGATFWFTLPPAPGDRT